jgi:hypothetical protein
LEKSFNELETDWLMKLSTKNGEIAGLKQTLADQALITEKYKGQALVRLIAAAALAGAWLVFFAFKVYRFFRP